MNIDQQFDSLGIDAVTAVELMRMLRLDTSDFVDNARFERFKDVSRFFKGMPDKDMKYIVRKITTGKNVDPLDHLWGYAELSESRKRLRDKAEAVTQKIEAYDVVGGKYEKGMTKELNEELHSIKLDIKHTDDQIKRYE